MLHNFQRNNPANITHLPGTFPMKTSAHSLDKTNNQILNKDLKLSSRLKEIWQWILQVATSNNELQIWQTQDRNGYQWWHLYDRPTGRHSTAASENELRELIERRYFRK